MSRPLARFLVRSGAFVALAAAAVPVAAQTVTDQSVRAGLTLRGTLGEDSAWSWSLDTSLRTRDVGDAVGLGVLERVIISRDLTDRSSVGAGYAYVRSFRTGSADPEQRFVQQYEWGTSASRVAVSFRSRFEERLLARNESTAVRFRQQAQLRVPLRTDGRVDLVLSDEVMVYLNETDRTARGLDSNRANIGLSLALGTRASLSLGYQNQYAWRRASANRRGHVARATVGITF